MVFTIMQMFFAAHGAEKCIWTKLKIDGWNVHIGIARIIGRTTSRLEAPNIPTKFLIVHKSHSLVKAVRPTARAFRSLH